MDLFCGNGYNGGKNTAKEIAVGRSEASSIDRLKEGLSQEELLEFFEVAKENYTNFIKTKEPDKYKQKDKIMKNISIMAEELGINLLDEQIRYFNDINEAKNVDLWTDWNEIGQEKQSGVRSISNSDQKSESRVTQREKILLGAIETPDGGYGYVGADSKTGKIVSATNDLSKEEKNQLLELAEERYDGVKKKDWKEFEVNGYVNKVQRSQKEKNAKKGKVTLNSLRSATKDVSEHELEEWKDELNLTLNNTKENGDKGVEINE